MSAEVLVGEALVPTSAEDRPRDGCWLVLLAVHAGAAASVLGEVVGALMGCRMAGQRNGDGAKQTVLDGGALGRGRGAVHVRRRWTEARAVGGWR